MVSIVVLFSCHNRTSQYDFVTKFSNDTITFKVGIKDNQLFFIKDSNLLELPCLIEVPSIYLSDLNKVYFYSDDCGIHYCCNMTSVIDSIVKENTVNYYYVSQELIVKEKPASSEQSNIRTFKFSKRRGVEELKENGSVGKPWPYDIPR